MAIRESVFRNRHCEGESLYFAVRTFGEGDLVFAFSDGGAEVAYPTCTLLGGELRLAELPTGAGARIDGVERRHTWIFDDGELGDAAVIAAARALKEGYAATVSVATVVASRRIRGRAGRGVIDRVVALEWREACEADGPPRRSVGKG